MSNGARKTAGILLELPSSWRESVGCSQLADLFEPAFFVWYMLIVLSEVLGQFKHHLRLYWSKALVGRISHQGKQLLEVQTVSSPKFVPFCEILSLHPRLSFSHKDALS